MISNTRRMMVALTFFMVASVAAALEDEGWPRVMETPNYTITMYEPQIDSWQDDRFEARAAVSVAEGGGTPVFGAVWISGRFSADLDTRMVDFDQITVPTVAFP
ncbi:MAG: hypothetical protein MUP13_10380, partial [Thermoanaerobaculales bacterium]|nr:hypothetical protein [Thermoanaerobaculales bacterium]